MKNFYVSMANREPLPLIVISMVFVGLSLCEIEVYNSYIYYEADIAYLAVLLASCISAVILLFVGIPISLVKKTWRPLWVLPVAYCIALHVLALWIFYINELWTHTVIFACFASVCFHLALMMYKKIPRF